MNDLNILKPTSGSTEIPLLYIGDAQDLSNTVYSISDNSIFRITALLDSRIWYYKTLKSGSGLFIQLEQLQKCQQNKIGRSKYLDL